MAFPSGAVSLNQAWPVSSDASACGRGGCPTTRQLYISRISRYVGASGCHSECVSPVPSCRVRRPLLPEGRRGGLTCYASWLGGGLYLYPLNVCRVETCGRSVMDMSAWRVPTTHQVDRMAQSPCLARPGCNLEMRRREAILLFRSAQGKLRLLDQSSA